MSRAQRCAMCLALLSLASFPGLARSTALSVGASLGLAIYTPPDNGDNVVLFEMPGNAGQVFPGLMPGFRFTLSDDSGFNSVIVEPSINVLSSNGTTINQFQGMLSYQVLFVPKHSTTGFVNAGVGAVYQDFESQSSSNAMIGVGIGLRSRSSHGHGQ